MVFWSTRGIEFYDPLQTIVGNRVEMNMGSGIYAQTGQGATITGNSIYLNGAGGPTFDVGAGIELANNASGMAICGNLIANWSAWTKQEHKQRYGIAYRGNAESLNNVANGNVFQDMVIADIATVP